VNSLIVLGIQLRVEGHDLVLAGPCHRLTDDLRESIREHKQGICLLLGGLIEERLAIQSEPLANPNPGDDIEFYFGANDPDWWQMLESEDLAGLVATPGPDGWPVDSIEPPSACHECGSLELWESAASDHRGLKRGTWRCLKCDSPEAVRRPRGRVDRPASDQILQKQFRQNTLQFERER
jgi:hypothetical protein